VGGEGHAAAAPPRSVTNARRHSITSSARAKQRRRHGSSNRKCCGLILASRNAPNGPTRNDVREYRGRKGQRASYRAEKTFVHLHFLDQPDAHSEFQFFEELALSLAINQINRGRAISRCLPACICSKCARSDNKPLVGPAHHCSTEIAHDARSHRPLPALALEQDVERDQIDTQHSDAIDPTVTGTSSDLNARETRFPQDLTRCWSRVSCSPVHRHGQGAVGRVGKREGGGPGAQTSL